MNDNLIELFVKIIKTNYNYLGKTLIMVLVLNIGIGLSEFCWRW